MNVILNVHSIEYPIMEKKIKRKVFHSLTNFLYSFSRARFAGHNFVVDTVKEKGLNVVTNIFPYDYSKTI